MSSVINTNIASLNAQRNLNSSQGALQTSLQRLSSGLRINSAKDDAAGLAISQRMTAQINGSTQAVRNANDGISLVQTAEGDLSTIGDNLQRIRELAVQSANATNNGTDRTAMDKEAQQLLSEIDRMANNSSFNGVKLLNGSFTKQDFQVGANNTANDRLQISKIANAQIGSLGQLSGATTTWTGGVSGTATDGKNFSINGTNVVASSSGSAKDIAQAINDTGIDGVTAQVSAGAHDAGSAAADTTAAASGTLKINGIDTGLTSLGIDTKENNLALVKNKIDELGITGLNVDITGGKLDLSNTDGSDIKVEVTGFAASDLGVSANALNAGGITSHGAVSVITPNSTPAFAGSASATLLGSAPLTSTVATVADSAASSIDLKTADGAKKAINIIDRALKTINSSRADLGAIQNRFSNVVSGLQTQTENLTASRSRIQDADFAAETANMTRNQILQQAGTAMLAQANSLPNGVLSLLRG